MFFPKLLVLLVLLAAVVICKKRENKLTIISKCVEDCSDEKCMTRCFKNFRYLLKSKKQRKQKKAKASSDEVPAAPVTKDTLMQKYIDALYAHYSNFLSTTQKVQIFATPLAATWDTTPAALSSFGNQMTLFNGKTYNPDTKRAPFYAAYGDFLNNINDISNTDQTELKALKEQLAKAEEDFSKFMKEQYEPKEKSCADLYEKSKASIPGTFEDFKRKYCVMTYLESRRTQLQGSVKMMQYRIQQVSRETKAEIALSAFQAAKTYDWVEKSGKLAQFKANIANKQVSGFTLVVSTSTSSSEESEVHDSSINTPKTKSDDVIVEKTVKLTLTTTSSKFYMRIEIPAHYALEVSPASWFDNQVVSFYKSGPFKDQTKATTYFGEQGSMNMMKTRLYLVHKPKVVMHLNENDAKYCSSLKEQTTITGIELLPFKLDPKTISVSKLKLAPEVTTGGAGETLYKVEMEAVENDPLIIAAENLLL